MSNITQIRKSFPILDSSIQLSSCSQSALHLRVKNAVNQYISSWEHEGMDWESWMGACEEARMHFATMINADLDEVAIVSSVSHAVSSIATSLNNQEKSKVLITDFDFPTVGHVWLSHQERFNIEFIEADENGIISLDTYIKHLDQNTSIVNTSHVSFYNGFKQDITAISEEVHKHNALLFVDAYQSAGQVNIDVKKMGIDMLAAGMQKYMLGIPGIAFLYVKKEISEKLTPKITGWFGQENPFAFEIKNSVYAPSTRRFDSGTFPMINGFAAKEALAILLEQGVNNIESYLTELSYVAIEEAKKHNFQIASPLNVYHKGSNTAIKLEKASQIEKEMKKRGFIVSARNDVLRFAPHFYNTKEDIQQAFAQLATILNK